MKNCTKIETISGEFGKERWMAEVGEWEVLTHFLW